MRFIFYSMCNNRKVLLIKFILLLHVIGLVFSISTGIAMAGNEASLPPKSEWLPGKIRRGEDGKLYLETPEKKSENTIKKTTKSVTKTSNNTTISDPKNTKTIYKNSVTISWSAPTINTDGSPLIDLAGYKVYYWTNNNSKKETRDVKNVSEFKLDKLNYGETYFFAVTAYSSTKLESDFSKIIPIRLEKPVK